MELGEFHRYSGRPSAVSTKELCRVRINRLHSNILHSVARYPGSEIYGGPVNSITGFSCPTAHACTLKVVIHKIKICLSICLSVYLSVCLPWAWDKQFVVNLIFTVTKLAVAVIKYGAYVAQELLQELYWPTHTEWRSTRHHCSHLLHCLLFGAYSTVSMCKVLQPKYSMWNYCKASRCWAHSRPCCTSLFFHFTLYVIFSILGQKKHRM